MKLYRRKFCECGCGQLTKYCRGKRNRFIIGHSGKGKSGWSKGLTKKDHSGIAAGARKRSRIFKGRTKYNHLGVAAMAEKRTGRNKENDPGVAAMAEKLKGRNKYNDPGIAASSKKQKGRTKETHSYLAASSKRQRGRTKETHLYIAARARKLTGRTKYNHLGVAAQSRKMKVIMKGRTKETHPGIAVGAEKRKAWWKRRKDEFLLLGKPVPFSMISYNPRASKWFQRFDELADTKGIYAAPAQEEFKVGWYSLDYINHTLKLIMEWDEPGHYKNNKLNPKDISRQSFIQRRFPHYKFIRIRQETFNGKLIRKLVKELANKDNLKGIENGIQSEEI